MALEVWCSAVGHWPIVLQLRSSSICLQTTKYCLLYTAWWRSKHSVSKLLPHVKQYSGPTVAVPSMAQLDNFWTGTHCPLSQLTLGPSEEMQAASHPAVCQEASELPVLMILRAISSLIDSKSSVLLSLLRKAEQQIPRSPRNFLPQCLDLPCTFFSQCMGDTCTFPQKVCPALCGPRNV